MINTLKTIVLGSAMALAASSGFAQESSNKVGANTDWYVFEDQGNCWAVSQPKETVNADSAGNLKSVKRSDILLFVSYNPSKGVKGQVSFVGGYPFAGGSEVNLEIGSSDFTLFTDPAQETAWPTSPEEDARIIAAMKRGATATFTGRSSRGTVTKDTFSLLGFTASVEDAAKRCGS